MRRKNIRHKLENEKKKKFFKRFLKRLILFFCVVGFVSLFVSQTYSLTKPVITKEINDFTKEFVRIRELSIVGASEFADKEIRSFVNPLIELNPNIFTFPVENVKLFLATRPYIDKAVIRKEFPKRLVIEIKEKKPIAILLDSELKLLDENGEVIRPMAIGENIDVPVVTLNDIDDDSKSTFIKMGCAFIALDNQSMPYIFPSEIRLHKNYLEIKSLELKTKNSEVPSLYVGYDEVEKKILNIKKLWTDIVNKKENIEYVDVRYSKGLSVKLKTEQR